MRKNLLTKIVATTALVALATTNVFASPFYNGVSQRRAESVNYNYGSYGSCINNREFVDYDLENMTEEEYYAWVDAYEYENGDCFFSDYSYDEMRDYMNNRGSCGGRGRSRSNTNRRFY